jgi:hypothetical protein
MLPSSPREGSSLSGTFEQIEYLLGVPRDAINIKPLWKLQRNAAGCGRLCYSRRRAFPG